MSGSAGAYWIWSPTEGKFISPETQGTQKTAEEQFEHALKLRESGEPDQVIRELKKLVLQYPQSAYAPEAQFMIASLYEDLGKPVRAAVEYQKLVREFPRSEKIDETIERLYQIGNLFLTGEKQKVMGMAILPVRSRAADIFRFILEQAPYGPYGDHAQLGLGVAYRKMGRFEEAVGAFETLIANYSTSSLVDEAHYQLAETSYELSQNVNRDQSTLTSASAHLKEFIQQYGHSSLAERARILKQQLDEQDSEKNYRIGFYYEKQGFMDSAWIYYEGVVDRYPQTAFASKAAERLQHLRQPSMMMEKGKDAIERRLAEVRSLLQALDKEESQKGKDAVSAPETVQLRKDLEAELATLAMGQRHFQEDAEDKFRSRRKAFRGRDKNLKLKFKMFAKRKKSFRGVESPALQEVFDRWQESLVEEQAELTREREVLRSLGIELKGEGEPWYGWVPFLGPKEKVVSEEEATQFRERKWSRLERRRDEFKTKRGHHERELAKLAETLDELDRKEFEWAQDTATFQKLMPSSFKKEWADLEAKRIKLDESIKAYEARKKEFEAAYGRDAFQSLGLELELTKLTESGLVPSVAGEPTAQSVEQLLSSGANLEALLASLQTGKALLGERWLVQKERLDTLLRATGQTQGPAPWTFEGASGQGTFSPEDQGQQLRLLKKRIKYLERQIRSRLDEIEDWQRDNDERMEQLDQLLHPDRARPRFDRATGAAWTAVSGTYKLGRAFLFGLPNRNRELVEEARERLAGSDGTSQAGDLKAVRGLQEEIELQSVLIQGRAEEITELQAQLGEMHRQAKQFPGFSYQSMLIERFPSTFKQSLAGAKDLLGAADQNTVLEHRVDQERKALRELETALAQVDRKIETAAKAVERTKKPSVVENPIPSIISSIAGDAEQAPATAGVQPAAETQAELVDETRKELESKIVVLKNEIEKLFSEREKSLAQYEQSLFVWYQAEAREEVTRDFPPEGKRVLSRKISLISKREKIGESLAKLVQEEKEVVQSQREFLDRKLTELEKRLGHLKSPSESLLYSTLSEAIKQTAERRDALIRDIAYLESLPQK